MRKDYPSQQVIWVFFSRNNECLCTWVRRGLPIRQVKDRSINIRAERKYYAF